MIFNLRNHYRYNLSYNRNSNGLKYDDYIICKFKLSSLDEDALVQLYKIYKDKY